MARFGRRPLAVGAVAAATVVLAACGSSPSSQPPGPASAATFAPQSPFSAQVASGQASAAPLAFEPNAGRFASDARYVAHSVGGDVRLTDRGALVTSGGRSISVSVTG